MSQDPILYIGEPLRQSNKPRSAKEAIQNMTDQDRKVIALEATVAQQAKMIERLRGGPTPLYTAVDMANAARDGFRDGAASVVVELPQPFDGGDFTMYDGIEIKEAIIAAGGRIKE